MTGLAGIPIKIEHASGKLASGNVEPLLHEIGHAQDIPESFLAKILQSLVHAGLAESRRGARGGFALGRPARDISMRAVVEAVDGPIALNACVLYPDDCERSARCAMQCPRTACACTTCGRP